MLSLPTFQGPCTFVGMVDLNELEMRQRQEYAAALRALREEKGWTQQDAADAARISLQGWANYERAQRQFKPGLLATVTRALDVSMEQLELRRAQMFPPEPPAQVGGFAERSSRAFELPMESATRFGPGGFEIQGTAQAELIDLSSFFGPDWRVLQLPGEDMAPYAEPGGFVTYNIRRAPQPGKGCVVQTMDNKYLVRRYEGMKDGQLQVTILHPQPTAQQLPLTDIRGVFPIGMRMD